MKQKDRPKDILRLEEKAAMLGSQIIDMLADSKCNELEARLTLCLVGITLQFPGQTLTFRQGVERMRYVLDKLEKQAAFDDDEKCN